MINDKSAAWRTNIKKSQKIQGRKIQDTNNNNDSGKGNVKWMFGH
jgi:hypothetical protein